MSDQESGGDRRRHERRSFKEIRGGVQFSVRIGERMADIREVHDVSISGMRLSLLGQLNAGQSLELIAKEDDFSVSVIGTVRWVKPASDGGTEFGVEFDNHDVDNNILFFMSLRKYLDGFDDAPLKDL